MVARFLLICALSVSSAGCAVLSQARWLLVRGTPLKVEPYKVSPTAPSDLPGVFQAGAGRADITPPPGFPTGGHGPVGNLSRGYWGRLYARAFFFRDVDGRTLTLVTCDLFALPRGLQADVARRVALEGRKSHVWLPPDAIVIAATHTHQGPGNYMTAQTYNEHGSFVSGFSKPLFDFLSERIASAIDAAIADALAHTDPLKLSVRTGLVDPDKQFQLNRSPRAFFLDWNRQGVMATLSGPMLPGPNVCAPDPGENATDAWDLEGCPRLRAVDRNITLLSVQRGSSPVGTLVFFASHPTTLIGSAPFYSGDFAGYAATLLEREWAVDEHHPVVGFFNGAEGDVVTRRLDRDLKDVRRVGEAFKTAIDQVLAKDPRVLVLGPILAGGDLIKPKSGRACVPYDGGSPVSMARMPVMGAAGLGGGEGDRSVLFDLGWREGARDIAKDNQGAKLPALDSQLLRQVHVTPLFAPRASFPSQLPLVYANLSGFEIAALPAEVSTETGLAIRRALNIESGLGHERLELIGLAGEYTGYVASPSEYALQDYMGASTIWGPQEGPYFACTMHNLQHRVTPGTVSGQRIGGQVFWPGTAGDASDFGSEYVGDRRSAPDEDLEKILRDVNGAPERKLPYFEWTETFAHGVTEYNAHAPAISVIEAASGAIVSSSVFDFLAMLKQPPADKTHRVWALLWTAPLWDVFSPATSYRFKVDGSSGATCSAPFRVDLSKETAPGPVMIGTCP